MDGRRRHGRRPLRSPGGPTPCASLPRDRRDGRRHHDCRPSARPRRPQVARSPCGNLHPRRTARQRHHGWRPLWGGRSPCASPGRRDGRFPCGSLRRDRRDGRFPRGWRPQPSSGAVPPRWRRRLRNEDGPPCDHRLSAMPNGHSFGWGRRRPSAAGHRSGPGAASGRRPEPARRPAVAGGDRSRWRAGHRPPQPWPAVARRAGRAGRRAPPTGPGSGWGVDRRHPPRPAPAGAHRSTDRFGGPHRWPGPDRRRPMGACAPHRSFHDARRRPSPTSLRASAAPRCAPSTRPSLRCRPCPALPVPRRGRGAGAGGPGPVARARGTLRFPGRHVRQRTRNAKKPPPRRGLQKKSGGDLLSQGVPPQVPSALAGLTSVFGMGTGVTPPLWPPETGAQVVKEGRGTGLPKRSIASTSEFVPSPRPISTGRLNTLLCVHLRPINVVVWPRALPG